MKTFLTVLVIVAMLGTLGVLFAGMFGMVRGGGDPARSNALMRWRVILQAATLILFVLLMSLLRG
jgi:NADH:ubiquinone oxidoreductase subunit 6 (subunit J)